MSLNQDNEPLDLTAMTSHEHGSYWFAKGRRWSRPGIWLGLTHVVFVPLVFMTEPPTKLAVLAVQVATLAVQIACFVRMNVLYKKARRIWGQP